MSLPGLDPTFHPPRHSRYRKRMGLRVKPAEAAAAMPPSTGADRGTSPALRQHVPEHLHGGPAIELEAVCLLVGAERGSGLHAGLAVDLVGVQAVLGQVALHA